MNINPSMSVSSEAQDEALMWALSSAAVLHLICFLRRRRRMSMIAKSQKTRPGQTETTYIQTGGMIEMRSLDTTAQLALLVLNECELIISE
jgi:hypothetical protein